MTTSAKGPHLAPTIASTSASSVAAAAEHAHPPHHGENKNAATCRRSRQRHLGQAQERARVATGVDEKSVYHDYRDVCARPDVDVIVIASPDHCTTRRRWRASERQGRLSREADDPHGRGGERDRRPVKASGACSRSEPVRLDGTILEARRRSRRGSRDVVWESGGFGRNAICAASGNYAIDPDATEKTLDWKAFLGSSAQAAVRPERYFAGASTGTIRRHRDGPLLPFGLAVARRHRRRVPAQGDRVGGIYLQKTARCPIRSS